VKIIISCISSYWWLPSYISEKSGHLWTYQTSLVGNNKWLKQRHKIHTTSNRRVFTCCSSTANDAATVAPCGPPAVEMTTFVSKS
jgi:hypothetical protein